VEALEWLKQWEDKWLEAEPQWATFVEDVAGERSMPGIVRLPGVVWALDHGHCTYGQAAGVIWSVSGRGHMSRAELGVLVREGLSVGRILTPALAQEILTEFPTMPSDGVDEGLECRQHRCHFDTFRAYLQHYREAHRES
jgi:hypothetical protein